MAGLCACVNHLSKEDIRKLIETTERPQEFINDENLRQMFRCEGNIGSARSNAFKYLDIVEESQQLLANPELLDDKERRSRFFRKIMPHFKEEYVKITTKDPDELRSQRERFLEQVLAEYTVELGETVRYKRFKEKLEKAYQGKIKIEKDP